MDGPILVIKMPTATLTYLLFNTHAMPFVFRGDHELNANHYIKHQNDDITCIHAIFNVL